jgi:hypothetical protein
VIYVFVLVFMGICGMFFTFVRATWVEGFRILSVSIASIFLGIILFLLINFYRAEPF